MSTRSQIKVKGSEIMIYKHSDGYPSEVMPTLKEVMTQFIQERGNEPDYALAQIMRAFARHDEERKGEKLKQAKRNNDDFWIDIYSKVSMTGWGLDTVIHGDIEYLYEVDLEKGRIIINNSGGFGDDLSEQEIVSLRAEL